MKKFTMILSLVQLGVSSNKQKNLQRAAEMVAKAASAGANVVVLPECFNSPYGTKYFEEYAEPLDGPTCKALSSMAKDSKVYLIGGSFPERKDQKLYNTCTIWNKSGSLIGVHRKIHLFDIDVPGKIRFKESDVLSSGDEQTLVDTEYGKIGIGICYDIRFPELAMIAARKGAIAMIYPGAFNTTTGPLHWELLQRARAVDNQIFVAACSPARDVSADYHAYGHSTIVDPMGQVLVTTDEKETIVTAEISIPKIHETRSSIPVSSQRRFDLYPDISAMSSK
jgi:predicted amidohydrolase